MTQSQSSAIKFSSFIFLPPEVSDSKTTGGGHVPPNIYTKGLYVLSPTFSCHKANILLPSSVVLFFLAPEVSNNKSGWMGGREDNYPQIIWLYPLNNMKILPLLKLNSY